MSKAQSGMVSLERMTRERFHELYRDFIFDPCMFMDISLCEKCNARGYDKTEVDARFDKHAGDDSCLPFAVMLKGKIIGEVVIKHIDREKKQCELGIHLQNDAVKGKGYGTEAERLAIAYAINELSMERILADSIIKNTRSQHILEKLGFRQTGESNGFKQYELRKTDLKQE